MYCIRVVVHVQSESRDALVDALSRDAKVAREMSGCQRFELLSDIGDANRFVLLEEWSTADDFEAYRASAIFKETMSAVEPLLAEPPQSLYVSGDVVR